MRQIIIKNLSVKHLEILILKNLNLTIEKVEFIVLFGKSGSGKTTFFTPCCFFAFSEMLLCHITWVLFFKSIVFFLG
jgi:ABC-type polar amino acid transport system ATPase subunit